MIKTLGRDRFLAINRSRIQGPERLHNFPEYFIYKAARYRCISPKSSDWLNYGGRGVQFQFQSFWEFYNHIGPRPFPELTLERIDNDRHYEIGNVRWATRKEQAANSRRFQKLLRLT